MSKVLWSLIGDLGSGPLLVHSDLLFAGRPQPLSPGLSGVLAAHTALLLDIARERGLWMPTFNYGYTRHGIFDVRNDPSEVGQLTEHFRRTVARWRTTTPVFSFAGVGAEPPAPPGAELDPFGASSAFAELVRADAEIVFYGATLTAATFIHHAERISGGPLYRYDKRFPGTVQLQDGSSRPVELLYHVRPAGRTLAYDWSRLLADLVADGIPRIHASRLGRVMALSARALISYWVGRLEFDRLYLLDEPSRSWVNPLLERLGRRFELADFEGDQPVGISTVRPR